MVTVEIKKMENAFLRKNVSDIGSISHKLKTTFSLYELNHIFNTFNEIESLCETDKPLLEIRKKYSDIKDDINSVIIKLVELKQKN